MKNGRKRSIVWAMGAIVVTGLVVTVSLQTNKVPVRVATVEKTDIQSYVSERARTTLPHIYRITMPLQGSILPLTVKEGQSVKVNQIVGNIDDIDWQDSKKESKDIIKAMSGWISALSAQVESNELRKNWALTNLNRQKKLTASNAASQKSLQDSQYDFLNAKVKLNQSSSLLAMSKALDAITQLLPDYVKRNLAKTIIKSPIAGTVLKKHVWNKKVLTPGAPLLDIGDLTQLEVTADVLSEQASSIKKGDRVIIFNGALGEEQVQGRVRQVEPQAFTKVSSLGVDEQRVPIKVVFAEDVLKTLHNKGIHLGLRYRLRVRIVTAEHKDSLTIPRTALFQGEKNQWQVYIVKNGKARLQTVDVGLLNDYKAEVTAGLQLGQQVIIVPESSIVDGKAVVMSNTK